MTFIQRLLTALLPKSRAEEMRIESLSWMMRCPCGHERSVWDSGGIRWKATGNPRRRLLCPGCRRRTWHTLTKKTE